MQEYASTSQLHLSKPSCHESKSFFEPPPPKPYMQEYASTSQLHLSKTSCHDSKSFFNPPQNPTCKSIPQLHSLPYPRLLVTIPSHFLNLPPPKPYMQEYSSTPQPSPSKTSCHDSKSFSKPPPQNPTCKSIPQLHSLPLSRFQVIF